MCECVCVWLHCEYILVAHAQALIQRYGYMVTRSHVQPAAKRQTTNKSTTNKQAGIWVNVRIVGNVDATRQLPIATYEL